MTAEQSIIAGMKAFIDNEFAPMIQQLGIIPQSVTESGAVFFVPDNAFMMRSQDIVSGQAIVSIADTVGVLTLFAHNASQRPLTTIDMTSHFMRPLTKGGMQIETRILSNGRRLATVFVEARQQGAEKLAASSTCAYAYLDGGS